MKNYEINRNTLMIIPIDSNNSMVYEIDNKFKIPASSMKIVDNSCKFFGSSYEGRFQGTKKMLNISHKSPIIIEESNNIIFFPTTSPRLEECSWICLNHIKSYYKIDEDNTLIKFYCGKQEKINVNFNTIDNQILRSARLQVVLEKIKEDFNKKS